jgi:4-oxalocrotonate tautomerase
LGRRATVPDGRAGRLLLSRMYSLMPQACPPRRRTVAGCPPLDPVRLFTERITAMPIITVQQSPRPLEAKRRLVAGMTDAFVDAYGVRPEHVQIFIDEVGHENWAKGGKLAVDDA